MEQLKTVPVSEAHLLCLMEQWFDRTQAVVKALADFDYVAHDDGRLECPFCRKLYAPRSAARITAGKTRFRHKTNCLVLEARTVRGEMLADAEAASREDTGHDHEAEAEWEDTSEREDGAERETNSGRNVFRLFQLDW